MKYRYIGKSGLRVSPICLGTMTFGSFTDEEEAFKIMDKAYDRGINFFDTAELYPVPPDATSAGLTEEIIGKWLKTKSRDSLIIASKVSGAASGWFVPPQRHGLTAIDRFHIERAIEGSLRRLGTDYIDLYQMHWPDTIVPIEESMEAFDRLIESGKVRYLGTSNDSAHGLTKANMVAKYEKLTRFESIQNNFSLLNQRFLDSLSEVALKEEVSLLPYSPLAGGVLTGKYNKSFIPPSSRMGYYRSLDNPRQRAMADRFLNDKTKKSVDQYMQIAKEIEMSVTTMATAWSMQHDFVASTIIGATTAKQLNETLAALDVVLSDEIVAKCKKVHDDILYPMG
jgi:aryl-alcohol dehydrogenase-like predicted oxidoreductase